MNEIEYKMSKTKKQCKKYFQTLKKNRKNDLAPTMKIIKNEEDDIWSYLEPILMALNSTVLNRKMNKIKDPKINIELLRLDGIVNLILILNQLGIFEPDYLGDTYNKEIYEVFRSQDSKTLHLLGAKLHQLAFSR